MTRLLTNLLRKLCRSVGFSLGAFSLATAAIAQQVPDPPPLQKALSAKEYLQSAGLLDFFGRKTPYEFWLTAAILVCGLLFLSMSTRFLRTIDNAKVDHATRLVIVILVIVGT